jgi:flagellar protein FliS
MSAIDNTQEQSMTYGRKVKQYRKTEVGTAGKMDLVIMCYERAIQFLVHARMYLEEKQFEKKAHLLKRALDIVDELRCSLNFEQGGRIAQNLDAIYDYVTRILVKGDSKGDLSAFDEAVEILSELRKAWENIESEKGTQTSPLAPEARAGNNGARLAA